MALMETCFQVSTIVASTNSRSVRVCAHLYNKEKVSLVGTCRSRKMPVPALSLPNRSRRLSHVVCQANTVDQVLEVNEASWQSLVVGCEKPVLVEFWAPWCGPCRMLAPVIDELAKDYAGKIVCCKMNTDECPNIAAKFGIRSIPTVLMFKDGEKKESIIGAVAKDALITTIDKYLAN